MFQFGIDLMHKKRNDVKGILFDLDGTILDTRPAYIESGKLAFQAMNLDVPEDRKLLELPKRIELRRSINDLVREDPRKFLKIYLNSFYQISPSKTKPFMHVEETLRELSQKYKLAVITMRFTPGKEIIQELKQFNLDKYFSHVVTGIDTVKPKPSPEALIRAVAAIDIQMCECMIVGDSIIDVQAGKAAEIETVAVLSGLYTRQELIEAAPNHIIEELSELPKLLLL